jgi:hypothetical protein
MRTAIVLALFITGCSSASSGSDPADAGVEVDGGVTADGGPDIVVLCDAEVDTCGFEDRSLCPAAPPALRSVCADEFLGCAFCDPADLRTATTSFTCDLGRWSYDYQACLP